VFEQPAGGTGVVVLAQSQVVVVGASVVLHGCGWWTKRLQFVYVQSPSRAPQNCGGSQPQGRGVVVVALPVVVVVVGPPVVVVVVVLNGQQVVVVVDVAGSPVVVVVLVVVVLVVVGAAVVVGFPQPSVARTHKAEPIDHVHLQRPEHGSSVVDVPSGSGAAVVVVGSGVVVVGSAWLLSRTTAHLVPVPGCFQSI